MLRDFVLNFSSQRTLDFDQDSIFCDTISRSAQKWIFWVLDQTNLVGLSARPGVVQVSGDWLEKGAVRRGGIP